MKFILFQNIDSANKFGYNFSLRAAYLLGENIACSGSLSECMYYLMERLKLFPLDEKLKAIRQDAQTEEEILQCATTDKILKDFKKAKNKSAELRADYKKFLEGIDKYHSIIIEHKFENVNIVFGIKTMRELLHKEHFYFYADSVSDTHYKSTLIVPRIELLQLLLPDPEKGHPLFLMNRNDSNENLELDINIKNPLAGEAENLNSFYGQHSFNFPLTTMLNENELKTVREELDAPTLHIRKLLNEWLKICYENPNSTLGLEFFRENLLEVLDTAKNIPLENQTLKNYADITPMNFNSQIIFGEAPIERIWEIYRKSNTITEEIFQELLQIKQEQSPKFDGRWPIALFQPVPEENVFEEPDEIVSVRKSIALD